ncbi:LysR substrate-binding domain-containing protein [Streptomyces aurantiacus]|uniref:Putative HTH-type transcriptional regulator TtuA n=1 Tax=Streptomyces aurantiacus JA 4570 TaxID=1286094 RepID=S3ZSB4_9ACTN|nr:LysR family substrate-binding domain-containing protein [Streptomyces aurantiacus]EPH46053.1 putative HTH-type transcriptional regulator TtuA [Streptomyces aurantiacus JA 4570]
MASSPLDLRLLSSFLAVVEEGHFGRAAARLFLSPPAVTAHVRRLETELGTLLLYRSPAVTPTPAGERLAGHARALLAASAAALDDMADMAEPAHDTGRTRPLRIGIMGHGSAELTPASINAYRRARPEVPLEISQLDFTEHSSALVEDRVDVAFVRPTPDDERVTADALTTEQRIVAVPAHSALADAHATGVTVADVAELPFVRVPGHTPRPFTDYLYFDEAGSRRGPDFAVTPQEVLTSVIMGRAAGSGLKSFARYYAWPGAVFVPVVDAPWESSYLAVRADDDNPEVRIFRALAVALARELGPTIR